MAEALEYEFHRLIGTRNSGNLLQPRRLEVLAETVLGLAAQHQDPLGQLIDLGSRIVVELLELGMQNEEGPSANIPMQSAQVGVEDLIIGQKALQRVYNAIDGRRIQVQIIHRFHSSKI